MSDSPAEARAASFVEHLKLIHLTLLAICLAAIIAVTSVVNEAVDRIKDGTITGYIYDPKTAALVRVT